MSVEAMALALNHSRAVGTDKVVLLGIANHEGDGGAWPSIATLAHYANVTQRAVQTSIRRLEAMGEIFVGPKAGGAVEKDPRYRTNLYRVLLHCPADCDGSTQHRVGVKPTSPLGDSAVKSSASSGEVQRDPEVKPTSPKPSLEPSVEPPRKTAPSETNPKASGSLVEVETPTPNQLAKKLVDDYWAFVKTQTGKHPAGITWKAMRALVVPFIEAGWSVAQLKKAMLAIRTEGKTFTRQVIEQHLDGRARKGRAASGVQAGADVDAKVLDEFEQAIAAGNAARAWAMMRAKARSRGDRWFDEVARHLDLGSSMNFVKDLISAATDHDLTDEEIAYVIACKDEIETRCRHVNDAKPAQLTTKGST